MLIFFAVVHKESGSAWGISFPDLPGCYSAADEEDDVFAMAQEALALYAEDAAALPTARRLSDLLGDPEVKSDVAEGAVLIAVPLIVVGRKARYNVMLDPALVQAVDGAAKAAGVSRSDYIAKALDERLRHDIGAQSLTRTSAVRGKSKRPSPSAKITPSKSRFRRKEFA